MESTATVNDRKLGLSGDDNYGILVFSHLRWGFVWQRPQQFLSRFAAKRRILFVEEPVFDVPEGGQTRMDIHLVDENIIVACPHMPESYEEEAHQYPEMRRLVKETLAQVDKGGDFECPLLWYYSPMMASWSLEYFRCRGVVYDCMDELSQFRGAPPSLVKNEQKLMTAADVVFTGGFELWLKKQKHHDNVHFFGCGVEYDHFARAQDPNTELPSDVADIKTPVLGWFGVVDERFDAALLAEMSEKRPDWSFVIVGPVVKIDPESLPKGDNIYYIGQRDYKELPSYCKSFDVCMMCFAINEATEFINPTKALEYLATGRPVVSTPVRDVVRQYNDVVYIAESADEFIQHAEDALSNPDEKRIRRGIDRAKSCSWENTVSKMEHLIKQAIDTRAGVTA